MNRFKGIRRRPLVTVCWLDREVSFALWVPGETGYCCCKVARRGERNCDAAGYDEAMKQLVPLRRLSSIRVRWIVLREAWPEVAQAALKSAPVTLALPGWIRRCWEALGPEHLPGEVVSGTERLESVLRDQTGLLEAGSGYLMRIGGRYLLIGRGAEDGSFRRISRRDLVAEAGAGPLCCEWLLQSRTLFRNRTGLDLKRIHVAEETGIHAVRRPDFPIELLSAKPILLPGCDESVFPASACRILHGACLAEGKSPRASLELTSLAQRQRWHRWDRRLRTSTCILLGCWSLMLLGACRNEAVTPELPMPAVREWERYKHDLKERHERWQRVWTEQRAQARPFDLIDRVVRDRPEGVTVSRVRVGPGLARQDGEYSVRLEGTFSGEAGHPAFKEWLESLRGSNPLEQVHHLEFGREVDGIAFSLQGSTGNPTGGGR